jgi:putative glutamine amidotransferase
VFELDLFRAFYQAGKPIFGICRGCQLINIALGGTVYQDLQSEDPHCTIRHSQGADGRYPTHHVTLTPGSSLYGTLGARAYVNSRHHQAIHKVAEALEVTAVAPDGVQESVESHDHEQVVAVQWHPENMWQEHPEMERLFADFLERVEKARK